MNELVRSNGCGVLRCAEVERDMNEWDCCDAWSGDMRYFFCCSGGRGEKADEPLVDMEETPSSMASRVASAFAPATSSGTSALRLFEWKEPARPDIVVVSFSFDLFKPLLGSIWFVSSTDVNALLQ